MSERLEIELAGGFTDRSGATHRRLVFGKRLTGADLIRADDRYGRVSQVGFECEACAASLVEFGTLAPGEMPHALLSLSVIERAEAEEAYDRFLAQTAPERAAESISDDTLRLAFGVRREGVTYTDVTFGNLLTGWDEVHADEQNLTGVERNLYLIGKQIVKLAAEGVEGIETGLTLADFRGMDAGDITALKDAAERWYEGVLAAHMKQRFGGDGDGAATEAVN